MTKFIILALFTTLSANLSLMAADGKGNGNSSPVYEMRVYYTPEGKLDDLHARFRDHTMKLFEKHGITNVGYFVPEGANPDRKLIYFLSYPDREARDKSWKEFGADPDWQKAAKESEKNGRLVTKVEQTFLQPTDYSPKLKVENKGGRVFELRTYTTPEGKLADLDKRFKDHTIELFKKHEMENLVYWHKTPNQKNADTTLVYMLAHKSRDAAKASFDAFRQDPDWVKAKGDSEKNGPLTVQDGVKSEFLVPTDYSPMK
jgi:hypothetical protein